MMLCLEIMIDVLDELRSERKVLMAITNSNYVSKYVKIDIDDSECAEAQLVNEEKANYRS